MSHGSLQDGGELLRTVQAAIDNAPSLFPRGPGRALQLRRAEQAASHAQVSSESSTFQGTSLLGASLQTSPASPRSAPLTPATPGIGGRGDTRKAGQDSRSGPGGVPTRALGGFRAMQQNRIGFGGSRTLVRTVSVGSPQVSPEPSSQRLTGPGSPEPSLRDSCSGWEAAKLCASGASPGSPARRRHRWSREEIRDGLLGSCQAPHVGGYCEGGLYLAAALVSMADSAGAGPISFPRDLFLLASKEVSTQVERLLPAENRLIVPHFGKVTAVSHALDQLRKRGSPGVLCFDWHPGVADRVGYDPSGTLYDVTGGDEVAEQLRKLSAQGWYLVCVADAGDVLNRAYQHTLAKYSICPRFAAHSQCVADVRLDLAAEMVARSKGVGGREWKCVVTEAARGEASSAPVAAPAPLLPTAHSRWQLPRKSYREPLGDNPLRTVYLSARHHQRQHGVQFRRRLRHGFAPLRETDPAHLASAVVPWLLGVAPDALPSLQYCDESTSSAGVPPAWCGSPGGPPHEQDGQGGDPERKPTEPRRTEQLCPPAAGDTPLCSPAAEEGGGEPRGRSPTCPQTPSSSAGSCVSSQVGAQPLIDVPFQFPDYEDSAASVNPPPNCSDGAEDVLIGDLFTSSGSVSFEELASSEGSKRPRSPSRMQLPASSSFARRGAHFDLGGDFEDQEIEATTEDKTFAFSDFSVNAENHLDIGIALTFLRSQGLDQEGGETFNFGDFAVRINNKAHLKVGPASRRKSPRGSTPLREPFPPVGRLAPRARSADHDATLLRRYAVRALGGHSSRIKCVATPQNERLYVSCSNAEQVLRMYDIHTGVNVQSYIGHLGVITSVAFSPDSKFVSTTSRDKTLRVWDFATARQLSCFEHPKVVICSTFSENGLFVASGCQDWKCRLFRVKGSREAIQVFREHTGIITNVCFEPHGEHVLSASADTSAKVWSAASSQRKLDLTGHQGVILSARFSRDGRRILSNDTSQLRVWDAAAGSCLMVVHSSQLRSYGPPGRPLNLSLSCFAPGSFGDRYVAIGGSDGAIRLIDVTDPGADPEGAVALQLHCRNPVYALQPGDRRSLVFGDSYGNVFHCEFG